MEEKKTIRPHSPYYIGLDVGTNSVGWAVTDPEYNVLRFKGNSMWGARLFEEAKPAADRRAARIARRRLERRKQRLLYLEEFFSAEIGKSDPLFFRRLHESALFPDDKTAGTGKYTLFNDPDFTDRDYLRRYPTVYHLRIPPSRTTRVSYFWRCTISSSTAGISFMKHRRTATNARR